MSVEFGPRDGLRCSRCHRLTRAYIGARVHGLPAHAVRPKILFYMCVNGHATDALPLPARLPENRPSVGLFC